MCPDRRRLPAGTAPRAGTGHLRIAFEYGADGKLVRKTAGENETMYRYDVQTGFLNRASDDDSDAVFGTYNAAGDLEAMAVLSKGDITTAQPFVRYAYAYDPLGNRTAMTVKYGQTTLDTDYEYDALNRIVEMHDPWGHGYEFAYDEQGRRTELYLPYGGYTRYEYTPAGMLKRLTNMIDRRPAGGLNLISSFTYDYDEVGKRVGMRISDGTPGGGNMLDYAYDDLDRLISADYQAPQMPPGFHNEYYAYDDVGNRTTEESVHDNLNRLIENWTHTYNYDHNGNMIERTKKQTSGEETFHYDPENRLAGYNLNLSTGKMKAKYTYDFNGRRIGKVLNPDGDVTFNSGDEDYWKYIYDGDDIILEFKWDPVKQTNSLFSQYVHGPGIDEPLLWRVDVDGDGVIRGASETFVYHYDGLGSVTEITNRYGEIVATYRYDSFGNALDLNYSPLGDKNCGELAGINRFRYTGREWDF
ncbi:MAG: hypothetical protein AB1742_09365 [bacterium]